MVPENGSFYGTKEGSLVRKRESGLGPEIGKLHSTIKRKAIWFQRWEGNFEPENGSWAATWFQNTNGYMHPKIGSIFRTKNKSVFGFWKKAINNQI